MSVVSGVTLHISNAEDFIEQGQDLPDVIPIVGMINAWLEEKRFAPLLSVERSYGGSKHPQVLVYGAGYNHFRLLEDEFANFVAALPWEVPENMVLLINPEEGPVKIVRPNTMGTLGETAEQIKAQDP